MSANPFTLSFGKKPLQYISRLTETNQILESFCAEIPSNQIYRSPVSVALARL